MGLAESLGFRLSKVEAKGLDSRSRLEGKGGGEKTGQSGIVDCKCQHSEFSFGLVTWLQQSD